jgi:hypothetical protein
MDTGILYELYTHHKFFSSFKVIEGYDLVEKISKVPTRNDNPVTPIKMISVRVA